MNYKHGIAGGTVERLINLVRGVWSFDVATLGKVGQLRLSPVALIVGAAWCRVRNADRFFDTGLAQYVDILDEQDKWEKMATVRMVSVIA